MDDFNVDPKESFLDLLQKQKKKLENLLKHYRKIEQTTPPGSQWRLLEESPFDKWVYPLARKTEKIMPTVIIEAAIQTLDEYIRAIENFSLAQLEAFFLGLGLKWIPFQYWGLKHLRENHKQHTQAINFLRDVESSQPKEQLWRYLGEDRINALHFIQPERLLDSEIISRDLVLINDILTVLSRKSF